MKESEYLDDVHVSQCLDYLESHLPKFSHQYTLRKAPKKKSDWKINSFISAIKEYWWPYKCYVMSGSGFHLRQGSTLADSAKVLKELQNLLDDAIKGNDDVKAQMACQGILAWGGVLKGNQQRVFNKADGLAACLSDLKFIFDSQDLDDLHAANQVSERLWMNSGFTKIFSILATDFCIYDGRVGAALGLLIRNYCKYKNLTDIPPLLQFPWGEGVGDDKVEGDRRNPSQVPYVFPKLNRPGFCGGSNL